MQQQISGEIMQALEIMLAELESSQLEVVLVPSKRFVNHGGCIRVAANKNARWYRRYCAQHSSDRVRKNNAHDTKIKRRNTILALNGILAGTYSGKYYDDLIKIARSHK